MSETKTPTTILTFNEKFSYSHVGVHPNMEAVNAAIKNQVARSVFEAIKLWRTLVPCISKASRTRSMITVTSAWLRYSVST